MQEHFILKLQVLTQSFGNVLVPHNMKVTARNVNVFLCD